MQLVHLAERGFGSPDSSPLRAIISRQAEELGQLRRDNKDLGAELFRCNEKADAVGAALLKEKEETKKLRDDFQLLKLNREKLQGIVVDKEKEIARLKADLTHQAQVLAREREAYFRSFPFSDLGRSLSQQYREKLVAHFRISGAFVKEAAKITSFFMNSLLEAVHAAIVKSGFPLRLDNEALGRQIPKEIPNWPGDKNERPDFEWWSGIWEETAAAIVGEGDEVRATLPAPEILGDPAQS